MEEHRHHPRKCVRAYLCSATVALALWNLPEIKGFAGHTPPDSRGAKRHNFRIFQVSLARTTCRLSQPCPKSRLNEL